MMAGLGPLLYPKAPIQIDLMGILAMYGLFTYWMKHSKTEIESSFSKIGFDFKLTSKKINEILVVLLMLLLLIYFIYPFFEFNLYVDFYVHSTKYFANILGFKTEISGVNLTGNNGGILSVYKPCLGIKAMYIFAAMIYLTRNNNKICWMYILSGIIILHLLNIFRLTLLFIYVQYHNNVDMIMEHHDLYNIVVYLFIFILWIIWFERYTTLRKNKKS